MKNVPWQSSRLDLLIAFTFFLLSSLAAGAQTIDCTQAPYNVPAGLPTSSITAVQDQAPVAGQPRERVLGPVQQVAEVYFGSYRHDFHTT